MTPLSAPPDEAVPVDPTQIAVEPEAHPKLPGAEEWSSTVAGIPLKLEVFEGPLDLLLHLVRKDKLDVNDIPISLITEQYLAYLDVMKSLNLDIASEFLVMASTLIYIKSRSLLPRQEGELEPEDDPEILQAELQRRLTEYEKFKEAAARLGGRPLLGREVFARDFVGEEPLEEELTMTELSLADLITAFKDVLGRIPTKDVHKVFVDRLSTADAIAFLLDRLKEDGTIRFERLLEEFTTRNEIVSFFLAILELVKERTVKVFQANPMGFITIVPAVTEGEDDQESETTDPD
ncbi:MAG TPA: segregation/condensation protein A [Candidatus Deferrimicrobiaceae bacterium]|jgi:segregation and condensation protein A